MATDKDYATEEYTEDYYRRVLKNITYRSHAWRLRWVDECLRPGPSDRIVDLGCGPGVLANHLLESGAAVHGIDLSEIAVRFARDFNKEFPKASFEVSDASACKNLADNSFDKGCSCDVTEHCGYDVMCGIFREARRLIKPGGLYLIYTPNPRHWLEVLKKYHIVKPDPSHTGLRTAPVIMDALKKEGWEIARYLRPPSMMPVVQWCEKAWSFLPGVGELGVYRVVVLARKPA
ncbi:MAG: class I SAM-dependent methyltransferase [Tepidisphaerales bacterium]